jgi:hypothetical protein
MMKVHQQPTELKVGFITSAIIYYNSMGKTNSNDTVAPLYVETARTVRRD